MSTPVQFQCRAARAASGALSSTLSSALAAPVGLRLPCSQLRMVSSETSMRSENSAWLSPKRLRTRRANLAASCMASASSAAACLAMSFSEVASKRTGSMRPFAREAGTAGSIVTRTVFIVSDLSLVGFACRDDADDVVPGCVDHHEQAMLNLAYQLVAIFAVAVPSVGLDQTVWVEEGSGSVGEIKPALGKAR